VRKPLKKRLGGELFADFPRRVRISLQHEGLIGFLRRSARFVIRLTPLSSYLGSGSTMRDFRAQAGAWYRRNWRHVTIVVPSYGDPAPVIRLVRSIRRTTQGRKVRTVVVDDGSPSEVQRALQSRVRADVILGDENIGFGGNVNRALRDIAESGDGDVVLLNSDVIARRGWLESLQYAAYSSPETGIVGAKLLYPDDRIQFAGTYRNLGQPEWFDHRYRFKPSLHGPANIAAPVLAVTGACMYLKRDALEAIGAFDERYGMAFEDIDYCLRAWESGRRVLYHPAPVLVHHESKTRGMKQGEREIESQRSFWQRWGDWFDARNVRSSDGRLRVVYVTEDTGVGGGHRDIFEHLNRLSARGHDVALYSLGGQPDWFDLEVPVRTFRDYADLVSELSEEEAIKVATWWATAQPVWLASVRKGIPVYFVQDIETSYYPGNERLQDSVLSNYREEFAYMTISPWNQDRLREMGLTATLMPPGIDLENYRPLDVERRDDVILAVGRSHHLKNIELTVEASRALPEPRPELWMFGIEPGLAEKFGVRYFTRPTDVEVNELMNRATAFVQTSRHEGFCLPVLEAMAAGTPAVSTDSHGNRGFCADGVNCLMPAPTPAAVAEALSAVLSSGELRDRLRREGLQTAADYSWEKRIDELEGFLHRVAEPVVLPRRRGALRRQALSG
jgi:GT2 family glycosyltransferase